MKKKNISISIFVTLGVTVISCSNQTDWNRFGLKGKVKSYYEIYYEAEKKFGEWENGEIEYYGHNRVNFNEKGNYLEIKYLDEDGELTGKLIPKYENGKVIEESYYDGDGNLINKTKINHISSSKIEFETYDEEEEKLNQGKSFIENNRIVKYIFTTYEESEIKNDITIFFEYNKIGQLISQKQTDKKGEIILYKKFQYLKTDDKGNWLKRLNYNSQDDEKPENIVLREYEYY